MTSDMTTLLPGQRRNSLIPAGAVVEGELAMLAVDNGYGVQVPETASVTPLDHYRPVALSKAGQQPKKISGPRSSAVAEGPAHKVGETAKIEEQPKPKGRKAAAPKAEEDGGQGGGGK
jgi:hypothetical protein